VRDVTDVHPERVGHIAARIGRLLLTNGADTGHTLRRVVMVADDLGCDAHVLVTAEAILVTVGSGAQFRTKVGHSIAAMTVDMGKLVAIERVVADIASGALAPDDVDARLDAIEGGDSGHSAALVMIGVAVTAASLARLFGADWPVVGAAFLAGLASTMLRRWLGVRGVNAVAATFLTALLSGLCAICALRLFPGVSPILCLTAAGMILVPGVPLINGVRDLIDGHSGNGIARLALGSMTVLTIGFALFVAAAVAGDALPVGAAPGSLGVGEDLLFSASAAVGYATLFNVSFRALWVCILCGMASHGLRTALVHGGLDIASASLVGAAAAGIVAGLAGRAYRVPPVAFAFPGIVAMIPGSYGFRAGIGGLHLMTLGAAAPGTLVAETLSLAITTIVVTIAIAIGLSLALAIAAQPRRGAAFPPSR